MSRYLRGWASGRKSWLQQQFLIDSIDRVWQGPGTTVPGPCPVFPVRPMDPQATTPDIAGHSGAGDLLPGIAEAAERPHWTPRGTPMKALKTTLALSVMVLSLLAAVGPAAAVGATLDPITGSGKTVTATFTPATNGQKTELQLRTIETTETDETPNPKWETIATSKQSSSGKTTFSVSDPREVSHQYRAISGSATSNIRTFAAPLPSKATGLPQVYFNSYEGDSVNTRTRVLRGRVLDVERRRRAPR